MSAALESARTLRESGAAEAARKEDEMAEREAALRRVCDLLKRVVT